jgi:hypothetical protein
MSEDTKQIITIQVARTLSEYDSVEMLVPKDATDREIIDAARDFVETHVEDTDLAFCDGSEVCSTRELRITSINKDDDEGTHVTDYVPIQPGYTAMGENLLDAAQRLELGGMTENQFILEALNSVYRNAPDPENAVSRAFIASYEECALEDTQQKIETLLLTSDGILPDDEGHPSRSLTLTITDDRGRVDNRNIPAPGIITHNGEPLPIFYPYKNQKTGEVALVHRDISRTTDPDSVTAIYPDGTERTFGSVMAFNHADMLRVRDYEEGEAIIHAISPFIVRPGDEDGVRYAGKPEKEDSNTPGGAEPE